MTPILVSKYFLWIFCIHKKYLETGFVKSYFKKILYGSIKTIFVCQVNLKSIIAIPFSWFQKRTLDAKRAY